MTQSRTTTDHRIIKEWITNRQGLPSVTRTGGDGGILGVDFGAPPDGFESVDWDEFFKVFDENDLAFVYEEHADGGGLSRVNKFINT